MAMPRPGGSAPHLWAERPALAESTARGNTTLALAVWGGTPIGAPQRSAGCAESSTAPDGVHTPAARVPVLHSHLAQGDEAAGLEGPLQLVGQGKCRNEQNPATHSRPTEVGAKRNTGGHRATKGEQAPRSALEAASKQFLAPDRHEVSRRPGCSQPASACGPNPGTGRPGTSRADVGGSEPGFDPKTRDPGLWASQWPSAMGASPVVGALPLRTRHQPGTQPGPAEAIGGCTQCSAQSSPRPVAPHNAVVSRETAPRSWSRSPNQTRS